jgi:hypothetical protein
MSNIAPPHSHILKSRSKLQGIRLTENKKQNAPGITQRASRANPNQTLKRNAERRVKEILIVVAIRRDGRCCGSQIVVGVTGCEVPFSTGRRKKSQRNRDLWPKGEETVGGAIVELLSQTNSKRDCQIHGIL